MSQGFYSSPTLYTPQKLITDKYIKMDNIPTMVKPRQSEPPLNINDKKIYQISKFSKEKQINISNPYVSMNNNSHRVNEMHEMKVGNIPIKNHVNPYSLYPQSSIQPRLSKTIPYQDDLNKKSWMETHYNQYGEQKDFNKQDTQVKRTLNRYETLATVTTPTIEQNIKRVPRFSEPALINLQEQNNKYSYVMPNKMPYGHSISTSDSSSTNTPPPRSSNSDSNKYVTTPSKISSNSYTFPSNSSGSALKDFRLAKKSNQFKITDFVRGVDLGSGKFGEVFLARHKLTGFICAIKAIAKSVIIQENIMNQFIRQLKIQSCLDHPNIIKLYGFFHDQKTIYLILQLGSQGQLYKVIKQKKKLGEPTVSYIIRQLCEAVKYLHGLNIIHRDIKPQNIVIQYGTVKICDFGWSVCRSGQLRSTFCGTPLYVSPEILKGQLYDQKIDIWALGILTYELLVGDTPFQIYTQQQLVKIIKQDITFPSDIEISNQAKDFILKILRKNPDQRMKVAKLIQHSFLNKTIQVFDIDI